MHLTIITYFGAESEACRVLRYYSVPYTMCIYSKQEASGVLDPASEKKHEAQQRWPRKPIGTLWRKYLLFFFYYLFRTRRSFASFMFIWQTHHVSHSWYAPRTHQGQRWHVVGLGLLLSYLSSVHKLVSATWDWADKTFLKFCSCW